MKPAKIAAIVVAALFVLLLVFIATFDIGKYKGTIEAQAKAATGRILTIGDIRLAASLTPTVTLLDVRFANAPWGTRPDMAIIKRLDVQAELLPLLKGEVNITGVSAEEPDLWIESDARGRANWELATGGGSSPSQGKSPLSLHRLQAKGVKATYKDPARTVAIALKSAAVSGDLQDGVVRTLTLEGAELGLTENKVQTTATVAKADIEADGKLSGLGITNLLLTDVVVSRKGADGFEATVAKLSLGKDGALQLAGSYEGQDLRASGALAPVAVMVAMNKPFPAKLTIEALGLKAESDLTIAMKAKRPTITGRISLSEIDLTARRPASGEKAGIPAPSDRLFADTPLAWSSLDVADAAVQLSVGKAVLPGGITVSNIAVPVSLERGRLAINPLTAGIAGGTINAAFTAGADKTVALKLEGKGMSAESLARELKRADLITQGPIDLTLDVRGKGNSFHAVMASLDGTMLANLGESRIRNSNLNIVGADVLQLVGAINPVGNNDPYTVARCGVVNFRITSGVARTDNGIALVTDKMQLTSSGTVNFATEQVNLSVNPRATGGLGIGLGTLAQAIHVSGPLARPGITMDKIGAAKTIGTLGMAFATGGTSLLAQGAKNRISGGDACQAARNMGRK